MSASLLSAKVLLKRGLTFPANNMPSKLRQIPVTTETSSGVRQASSFTYRLAAASSPKRAPPRPPRLGKDYWNYASTQSNTKPPYLASTKQFSGEDSFFVTTIGDSKHDVAFGVADGVGGWQESGVDPSVYSQALSGLMAGSAKIYEEHANGHPLRPKDLLQTAYDAVMGNPRIQAGGCTASLAVVSKDGSMESAK